MEETGGLVYLLYLNTFARVVSGRVIEPGDMRAPGKVAGSTRAFTEPEAVAVALGAGDAKEALQRSEPAKAIRTKKDLIAAVQRLVG